MVLQPTMTAAKAASSRGCGGVGSMIGEADPAPDKTTQRGSRMLKSELIEKIAAENPHLYQRDVEKIVNAILDTITAALARGERVELRGLGVFAVKTRDARTGRNPRDGTKVAVPEKAIPAFKVSKDMHRRLNPSKD